MRTTKYSETSIIARVLTREKGVQSIIVRGVRSSKSKNKAAIWHPGNILDFVLYFQSGKNLKSIKEFKLNFIYQRIHGDMYRSALLMFLTEVLNAILKEEDDLEDTEIYEFIENQYFRLDEEKLPDPNFHLQFMLQLSQYLGIYPKDNYSPEKPNFNYAEGVFSDQNGTQVLNAQISANLNKLMKGEKAEFTTSDRSELIEALLSYFRNQLGAFAAIKSHVVLHQVFGKGYL